MKLHERLNYILLGALWCMAVVLVLDFWLNTAYNFNMFSNAHWHYVATAQAANQTIKTGFYIAITLAIIMLIMGLYTLLRPRFRKIILIPITHPAQTPTPAPTPIAQPEPTPITNTPEKPTTESLIQRPPRLHIQPQNLTQHHTQKTNTTPIKPEPQKPRYVHEFREIFENNDYIVLTPKTISGVPLSLIALGANETLWLGACDISHEQMADVMLAFRNIFQETLEDIEIDINAFIVSPTDTDHTEAILDLASPQELSDILESNPGESESDSDTSSENMDAFTGYIETVLTYLGNKQ